MATFEEVNDLVQAEYNRLKTALYPDANPAIVILELAHTNTFGFVRNGSSGYTHNRNTILIRLTEENLSDWDILNTDVWPVWRRDLVHEMMHEYQFKILTEPSEQGVNLFNDMPNQFDGPEHNAQFYTAILIFSPFLGKAPVELIRKHLI